MMAMPTLDGFIEKLYAGWLGWQTGVPLSPEQLAARIGEAWAMPPAYRVTQAAQRTKAKRTLARARRVYRLQRRPCADD